MKVSTSLKHINFPSHFLSIFFWEQECETETYSVSLKASVVPFASIFQINFILVRFFALIFAIVLCCCIFALNILPLPFVLPLSFADALFFCPQNVNKKKRARAKSIFAL